MRSRSTSALVSLALTAGISHLSPVAADTPSRKPLGIEERNAVLALIKAVDAAQGNDEFGGDRERLVWDGHVLRSGNQTAYLPFRLTFPTDAWKAAVVYVRAVSRHDGMRASDERSVAREWLLRGSAAPPRMPETIYVGQGEMPVGGPAASSSRAAVAAPAQALTVLALQQREAEKQNAAAEAQKKKAEEKQRDPFVFPFEDYYVADVKAPHGSEPRMLERALSLPPGEYDVYVALLDRSRIKTSSPAILRRTITVPDFWNDELAVSSLILASEVNTLPSAPNAKQQAEHPYTFGRAEVIPVARTTFTTADVLSVVFQICNYGAPDSDLQVEYNFYRVEDGPRKLFNRTPPQQFGDTDLPPPAAWETVAFATQAVPLETFPVGQYELEVTVRDRLTRRSASSTVSFSVAMK